MSLFLFLSTMIVSFLFFFFFFFNDTATTEIYTLSLHDALPISVVVARHDPVEHRLRVLPGGVGVDRKSTRLNSSHGYISYAVFCLKKKKKKQKKISTYNKTIYKSYTDTTSIVRVAKIIVHSS